MAADADALDIGAKGDPWTTKASLAGSAAVHPGDTIWVRGGIYTGNFASHTEGDGEGADRGTAASGGPAHAGSKVNGEVRGNAKPVLAVQDGEFTWFWDFQVTNWSPDRSNPASGSRLKDARGDGIFGTAPGTKIINVVVHDTGEGIFCALHAKDAELYGNIISYNGWKASELGHGHAIYVRNHASSSRLIKNNILFDQFGYNRHAYPSRPAGSANSRVAGNPSWRGTPLVGGEVEFAIIGPSVTEAFSWWALLRIRCHGTLRANVTVSGNDLPDLEGGVSSAGRTDCREDESIKGYSFVRNPDGFVPGTYRDTVNSSKRNPLMKEIVEILPNVCEPSRAPVVIDNRNRIET